MQAAAGAPGSEVPAWLLLEVLLAEVAAAWVQEEQLPAARALLELLQKQDMEMSR